MGLLDRLFGRRDDDRRAYGQPRNQGAPYQGRGRNEQLPDEQAVARYRYLLVRQLLVAAPSLVRRPLAPRLPVGTAVVVPAAEQAVQQSHRGSSPCPVHLGDERTDSRVPRNGIVHTHGRPGWSGGNGP